MQVFLYLASLYMKFLICGLGNIGNEYAHTRHNIGFDVVAAFVAKHGGTFQNERLAYMAQVKIKGKIFVCICPTTFVNLSGKAVKYWLDKEKLSPERSLVILDEISLPLSKLRLNPSGGDSGHNGLKSIQETILTTAFPRMRFGIGSDFPRGLQADFVLSTWRPEEEPLVKLKIEKAVEAIEIFSLRGVNAAMNEINNKEYSL